MPKTKDDKDKKRKREKSKKEKALVAKLKAQIKEKAKERKKKKEDKKERLRKNSPPPIPSAPPLPADDKGSPAVGDDKEFNPYDVSSNLVEDVASTPDNKDIVTGKIRIDNSAILAIEKIDLPAKAGYHAASFYGWSLRKVKKGTDNIEEYVNDQGKKMKVFKLSARLSTLADLHRAVKKLVMTARGKDLPTTVEIAEMQKDSNDCIDLSLCAEQIYTDKIFRFNDFSVFVRPTKHSNKATGSASWYNALFIAKLKSEKVIILHYLI